MELFSGDYFLNFFMRYLHVLVGIAWIGLLYYFNLVQVPALAAYGDEAKARSITLDKLARRALWWFRWAAIATLGTGILITGQPTYYDNFLNWEGANSLNAKNAAITVGMLFGLTMAANVWMVIWKNQKVVIANATNVLNGGEADPNAAGAGRRAMLMSRQNMIFSVSMLFYMVGAAHFYPEAFSATTSDGYTFIIIAVVLGALLQLNALGKFGGTAAGNKMLKPYESHKNAIITSIILWLVLFVVSVIFMG